MPSISVIDPHVLTTTLSAEIAAPFAALIDARDHVWIDAESVTTLTSSLIRSGCRYFVCFGPHSEGVHDQIDEVMLDIDDDVITTFHVDEPIEDVAGFFRMIAMDGMKKGIVVTTDDIAWRAALAEN